MDPKYIDTTTALQLVFIKGFSISLPTLISWIRTYQIGKKVGGRWRVDRQKLIEMLDKGNPNGTT